MNKISSTSKAIASIEEVDTSIILIKKGLIEIQNMNSIKTQSHKHIPLLLLSNGFERLLKCILIFHYYKINNSYPSQTRFFRKYNNGHGLDLMLQEVITIAKESETMMSIPLSRNEIEYLEFDLKVKELFRIFSNYAQYGRYYYIDVMTASEYPNENNPVGDFERFRDDLYLQLNFPIYEFWNNIEEFNKQHIYIIANITKALCRCFTHADFGYVATMHSADVSDFTSCLTDEDIQKMRYLKF